MESNFSTVDNKNTSLTTTGAGLQTSTSGMGNIGSLGGGVSGLGGNNGLGNPSSIGGTSTSL